MVLVSVYINFWLVQKLIAVQTLTIMRYFLTLTASPKTKQRLHIGFGNIRRTPQSLHILRVLLTYTAFTQAANPKRLLKTKNANGMTAGMTMSCVKWCVANQSLPRSDVMLIGKRLT